MLIVYDNALIYKNVSKIYDSQECFGSNGNTIEKVTYTLQLIMNI